MEKRSLFSSMLIPSIMGAILSVAVIACLYIFVPQNVLKKTDHEYTSTFVAQLLPESLRDIQTFAVAHPTIAAINLIGFNFDANLRVPIYIYASPKYPDVKEAMDRIGQIPSQKIFSTDKENNQEFARLIKGDVVCSNDDLTPFAKFYHLEYLVDTVCRFPLVAQTNEL